MFSRLKGIMGMASLASADDVTIMQKPSRPRRNTQDLDATSVALRERIRARADKVETLVSELGDEQSEPLTSGPAMLFPQDGVGSFEFTPVLPREQIRATKMKVDFVIRNKGRAVVKGEAGDWLVRYPDGDYSVYSDREFRRCFRRF